MEILQPESPVAAQAKAWAEAGDREQAVADARPEAGAGGKAGLEAGAEPRAGSGAHVVAEVDIPTLLCLRNQLKQQLMEFVTAVHAGQESRLDHINEERFIRKAIKDLENKIEESKTSFQNKTLALQRLQFAAALMNKVKQNDNDSRLIMETFKHIVMVSKEIVECQQQTREKEQELMDIRKKRFSLKKAGERKLLQIHTMMKKEKEEQARMEAGEVLAELRKNFEKERNLTTVIQNVFQNIIIGSRVNWAEDPSLKAIVLQLEKNVYSL
ncbi:centromere protein H [Phalacrocorax carbo]|uniref:centromere protein H n=1 Tax=Phalacrocorax carbo TaxID=9209 RepID=UPI00311A32A2